ncbi:hypothetical protein [Photobacterium leiognathi]|uniref:hypothetical protein n=1 Tax=Photobacterium leiognathi TaxID=553611 RepID=UPI0029824691|nr:hypothetical protein [Photobacterium leiognathi]
MIPFSEIDKNRGVYCSLYLHDKTTGKYHLQCHSIIALNVQEVIEFHSYVHHYELVDLIEKNMFQRFQLANGTPLLTSVIPYTEFGKFNEFLVESNRMPIIETYNYWEMVKAELDSQEDENLELVAIFDFVQK